MRCLINAAMKAFSQSLISHGDDKGRATKGGVVGGNTGDIILEEIPPLHPQIACNVKEQLPCFVSHSGVILHQAQQQAQANNFLSEGFISVAVNQAQFRRNNGVERWRRHGARLK